MTALDAMRTNPPLPWFEDVVDLELWRWGTALADLHRRGPMAPSRCAVASCVLDRFPCLGRVTAQRLLAASRGSWPQRWTARLDAVSCGVDRLGGGRLPRWCGANRVGLLAGDGQAIAATPMSDQCDRSRSAAPGESRRLREAPVLAAVGRP